MFGWAGHSKGIISDFSSGSSFVQAYVSLFEQLCLATSQPCQRMIVVTSCSRGEGRTSVAMNLALCSARLAGCKTLLVDADPERPGLGRLAKVDGCKGMWQALTNGDGWRECLLPMQQDNLSLLPAGHAGASALVAAQPQRLESLTSQWCAEFDWIIVDTPPVLQSANALVLGRYAAGALLVVRAGRTRSEAVSQATTRLREGNTRLLGVVLNRRSFFIPRYVYQRL